MEEDIQVNILMYRKGKEQERQEEICKVKDCLMPEIFVKGGMFNLSF